MLNEASQTIVKSFNTDVQNKKELRKMTSEVMATLEKLMDGDISNLAQWALIRRLQKSDKINDATIVYWLLSSPEYHDTLDKLTGKNCCFMLLMLFYHIPRVRAKVNQLDKKAYVELYELVNYGRVITV
jgi:hypothetical protein